MNDVLAILASYLVGAIPFGLVMARLIKGVDLREVGSGNIGATNAMRVLGRPLGLLAFLLDFGKGALPAWLFAGWMGDEGSPLLAATLCGAAAVVGHCYPVYLGFRGGKGVATACGAIVVIEWPVFVAAGLVWLAVAYSVHYVSIASMAMGVTFPVAAWIRRPDAPAFIAGCAALCALILVRHRINVQRLREGTETRMGSPRTPAEGA